MTGLAKRLAYLTAVIVSAVTLVGCASGILKTRSLSSSDDPNSTRSDGSFLGLEAIAATSPTEDLVVLYVHGMGWTQQADSGSPIDIVKAIALRNGQAEKAFDSKGACSTSKLDGTPSKAEAVLMIYRGNSEPNFTDDPKNRIGGEVLGCVDKTLVRLQNGRTVRIFRLFWDDLFWNAMQWPHLGYDDRFPVDPSSGKRLEFEGYEDIYSSRALINRTIKAELVTYGLSDAALYMGRMGEKMRAVLGGAICASLSNVVPDKATVAWATPEELCLRPRRAEKVPFAMVTRSLGSRVAFDALKTDLSDSLAKRIRQAVANEEIPIFMLANQVPLIALSRIGAVRSGERLDGRRLKLIAFSDINDALSFELVPYFEQLYFTRCYGDAKGVVGLSCPARDEIDWRRQREKFIDDAAARQAYVNELGFEVVDVRISMASTSVTSWLFVNPLDAHSGHLEHEFVRQALMCGIEAGRLRGGDRDCN